MRQTLRRHTLYFCISLTSSFPANPLCGGDCSVVQYPDHAEIICVGQPQQDTVAHRGKKKTDAGTVDRKAAVRSLIKLKSQPDTPLALFKIALAEAKTDVKLYANAHYLKSDEDMKLSSLMNIALTSYNLHLLAKDACERHLFIPDANPCTDTVKHYRSYVENLNEALDYYKETWE